MATPADLAFLAAQPLLNVGDRRALATLLAGPRLSPRTHVTSIPPLGIEIARSVSHGPRRIYRIYGSGAADAPAEVAFEALSNLGLIPTWDLLFKGARYLEFARSGPGPEQAGRGGEGGEGAGGGEGEGEGFGGSGRGAIEVARIHLVYGLPGVSRIVHDRDFVLRAVRAFLPSGACALCCRSVGADEAAEGDPRPGRNVIRGWMWSSGYVVVPSGPEACTVNISLQVDPKGWIPAPIVNMSLEAIPLNIPRLRGALARLPPGAAARLAALNLEQALGAKPLAPAQGAAAAGAAGGSESASESDAEGEWHPGRARRGGVEDEEEERPSHEAPKRARISA